MIIAIYCLTILCIVLSIILVSAIRYMMTYARETNKRMGETMDAYEDDLVALLMSHYRQQNPNASIALMQGERESLKYKMKILRKRYSEV